MPHFGGTDLIKLAFMGLYLAKSMPKAKRRIANLGNDFRGISPGMLGML